MKFACVDGPEFDAHQVDFGELADRLTSYHAQERVAFERVKGEMCRLEAAAERISAAQAAEARD
jgi:ferredoxin--NADP+ reductase